MDDFSQEVIWGIRMSSELVNMDEFKEYRPLGSKRKSAKHYLVFFVHLVVAVLFFVTQLMNGFGTWFYGTGIVTPILLIINGYSYYYLENGLWYREEMIPFISRIVTTTEIETDRYCQFHTRIASIFLVLGWISIILCNILCTIGLVVFVPLFTAEDLLTRIIGELVAYAVIFGPYFL